MVKPINTQAIEKSTQTRWDDWCAYLDGAGAATLDHNSIVKTARLFKPISGWWAQGVAVAYEQRIGRRKPGQTSDGLFSVSISRTVGGTWEQVHKTWCDFASSLTAIDGQTIVTSPTTSATPKRLYWRCKFEDKSGAIVSMEAKTPSKVLIVVEHSKLLLEAQINERKRSWSALFTECFKP